MQSQALKNVDVVEKGQDQLALVLANPKVPQGRECYILKHPADVICKSCFLRHLP